MSKPEFWLPVSGFVPPFLEKWKIEISKKFPSLAPQRVEGVFTNYVLMRDGSSNHPSPSQAREILDRASREADALALTFRSLGPLESWVRAAAVDNPEYIDSLKAGLMVASASFKHVRKSIPKGRPFSPRARLVRMLAALLEESDVSVDSTASGDLSILTAIVLEAAGEKPDSAPKLVRDAFGKRKKLVQK